ncbi:hypothetical protein NDU88_002184 [Pleurodeles waltl]|uniref:Uncharacterized protein n=1 Tax=Pleurodeles waltl TaxID=8319 RepID=A0AAV7W255_PLEWA|nr:hypothetical protein NDU88_002184 [Pleurodeles waltl]
MERNRAKFGVVCDNVMRDKVLEYQLRTKLRHDTRSSSDELVVGQSVRVKTPGIVEKGGLEKGRRDHRRCALEGQKEHGEGESESGTGSEPEEEIKAEAEEDDSEDAETSRNHEQSRHVPGGAWLSQDGIQIPPGNHPDEVLTVTGSTLEQRT